MFGRALHFQWEYPNRASKSESWSKCKLSETHFHFRSEVETWINSTVDTWNQVVSIFLEYNATTTARTSYQYRAEKRPAPMLHGYKRSRTKWPVIMELVPPFKRPPSRFSKPLRKTRSEQDQIADHECRTCTLNPILASLRSQIVTQLLSCTEARLANFGILIWAKFKKAEKARTDTTYLWK